jgi:hypothetical protein
MRTETKISAYGGPVNQPYEATYGGPDPLKVPLPITVGVPSIV